MYSLNQRLKEMDGDTFQRFCFQLLKERHPGAELRYVEGASGDQGLDVFMGELSGQPAIWQCKSFPNGVRKSQKQQIRESLKTALRNFAPSRWILCLSIDMEVDAHRWFQRFQLSHAKKVEVGMLCASDIVHELMHRRSLRNAFFPGALIDVQEWKRAVTRSGELSAEELEKVTEANLEDYIERLKERDARFNYEVVFSGDMGPTVQHAGRGLIASVATGSKTLNVYVRDVQALRQDPLKLKLSFKATAAEKLLAFQRTGVEQEFSCTEIESLASDFFLLQDRLSAGSTYQLIVSPSESLSQRRLRTRVNFRVGGDAVEYGIIDFAPIRAGTDEVEFRSVDDKLPFRASFVLSLRGEPSTITFAEMFLGQGARTLQKFIKAISILQSGGEISVYDLERDRELFKAKTTDIQPPTEQQKWFSNLVDHLAEIESRFNCAFHLPSRITDNDLDAVFLLKSFARSDSAELESMHITLVKSVDNEKMIFYFVRTGGRFRTEHSSFEAQVFGNRICIGRCAMTTEHALFEHPEETAEAFRKAKIGSGIPMTLKPQRPVRFELLDGLVTATSAK